MYLLQERDHFGVTAREMAPIIFDDEGDTPKARAAISRALRGLQQRGYVRYFTIPTVAEDNAKATEGRRLALWNAIIRRRHGDKQDRKFWVATRKARRELGMRYVAPPQFWHILQPKGENEFMPWQHWIGMEPPGTYGEEHGVRIMRHRGAMRPRHYVLKMADYDKRDDPLG